MSGLRFLDPGRSRNTREPYRLRFHPTLIVVNSVAHPAGYVFSAGIAPRDAPRDLPCALILAYSNFPCVPRFFDSGE
jgi:hypothetical protein